MGHFEQAAVLCDRIGTTRWAKAVALARMLLARAQAGDHETAAELLAITAAAAWHEGQVAVERDCEGLRRTDLPVG